MAEEEREIERPNNGFQESSWMSNLIALNLYIIAKLDVALNRE